MKNPSDWPKFAQKYGDDAKIMEDFASWQRVLIDVGSKLIPAVDPPAVMAVSQLPQEEMMKLGDVIELMMEKSEVAEKIVMEVRADPRISSRSALVEALKEVNMKNPSDWPKFAQKYGDDAKIMEDFASWQRVLIDVG